MFGLLIPVVVIGLAIAILALIVGFARNYRKCPPNAVLVVYGQKRKVEIVDPSGEKRLVERGYRLVIGGATFVKPMLESFEVIELGTFQEQVTVTNAPNTDGVPVSVEAVANMKISSDPALLAAAVERLLSMKDQELRRLCNTTMEGQLRQLVGTLTIEKMITDREAIAQQVLSIAQGELNKLGITLDNFVITKISDSNGYIDALGQARTAQVKRDAEVAKAEATREQDVKTSAARLAGEKAKAESEKAISDAQRDKDIAIADNETQVRSRQARIEIMANSVAQEAQAELNQKTIAAEVAKVTADTELQKLEMQRNIARLDATTVTTARKEKEARIIKAEAEQEAAELEGEALRITAEKAGMGKKAQETNEAEGKKAMASAEQAELEAKAAGKKADLLATAAGIEAQGKAEGAAKEAILSAEAAGIDKKNKALERMTEGARMILVLDRLPAIIEETGEAGERIMGSMFEHVGAGLARIDNVSIVDMGGKNGDGNGAVANFALNIPSVVAGTLMRFKALGINVEEISKKLGIDASMLERMLGGALGGALSQTVKEEMVMTGDSKSE